MLLINTLVFLFISSINLSFLRRNNGRINSGQGLFLVNAQGADGGAPTGATSSPQSAGYSCDTAKCLLPDCVCASAYPPGGLDPKLTPQFITFTADDAIQSYTRDAVDFFLAQRRNPNACPVKTTWFTSLAYTNYSMVTDYYVAGNEIADHTMTHAGNPNSSEILGNLKALNAFAGIPISSIKGFRAPYLNFTGDTLRMLAAAGFSYDSSGTAASPADSNTTDAFWPYTLDYGFANNCLNKPDLCQGQVKLPGFFEIPMYATFDSRGADGIHLMDPWLDSTNMTDVLNWLKSSFLAHYNNNRQPFGIYTHPIHLAVGYPGVPDPLAERKMLNTFLDWAQGFNDTWFVTNEQLLEWIKRPTPIDNLSQVSALGCSVPVVDPSLKICNGITGNELGLLNTCPFDFPWTTCYGCPTSNPSPQNPTPPQNVSIGGVRHRLPANCSTAFFDPISNVCHCSNSQCAFNDTTRPIGSYSPNYGGGDETSSTASGTLPSSTSPKTNSTSSSSYNFLVFLFSFSVGIIILLV